MTSKDKLLEKLSELIDFRFNHNVEIITYKGGRDAGAYRWFTNGLQPQIFSHETMTEILRAKNIYFYNDRDSHGIVVSTEDMSNSSFFPHTVVNPKIEWKNIDDSFRYN